MVESPQLTPQMVRLTSEGADLRAMGPLVHIDSYIKIRFGEQTLTGTVHHDPEVGRMVVDFVVHGEEGLAGALAATAQPGEEITVGGPGRGWAPSRATGAAA
ncbi:siderophore-interacting protein [Luteococcus sp.]|uniref:siderophore-interacting protein n=1 Tax=Luteococcus sp. TaxID=1969402 RepID=UPI003734D711